MTNSRARLHHLKGVINIDSYQAFAKSIPIASEHLVFIFPSNPSHHTATSTLYSIKKGGGLASVAMALGEHGIPTLGLPTTGMPIVDQQDSIPLLARHAIANLYKAAGYGMHLVLPVREHMNTKYFSQALDSNNVEPSFWGGIESTANCVLGDFYRDELAKLRLFLNDFNAIQNIDPLFEAHYLEGEKAKNLNPSDVWFNKPKQPDADKDNSCTIS